jgi:hypothetical protein
MKNNKEMTIGDKLSTKNHHTWHHEEKG